MATEVKAQLKNLSFVQACKRISQNPCAKKLCSKINRPHHPVIWPFLYLPPISPGCIKFYGEGLSQLHQIYKGRDWHLEKRQPQMRHFEVRRLMLQGKETENGGQQWKKRAIIWTLNSHFPLEIFHGSQ